MHYRNVLASVSYFLASVSKHLLINFVLNYHLTVSAFYLYNNIGLPKYTWSYTPDIISFINKDVASVLFICHLHICRCSTFNVIKTLTAHLSRDHVITWSRDHRTMLISKYFTWIRNCRQVCDRTRGAESGGTLMLNLFVSMVAAGAWCRRKINICQGLKHCISRLYLISHIVSQSLSGCDTGAGWAAEMTTL